MLFAFFLSSTFLSQVSPAAKSESARDIAEKTGRRDAWQVVANGGVFALLAIASVLWPTAIWKIAGAGAIAAATADTWATEAGMSSAAAPRSIVTWKTVPAGTSGGVTTRGLGAGVIGAVFIAVIAFLLSWSAGAMCAAIVGGIGGSLFDSVLGATIQAKRWCPRCKRGTERAVHACGTRTQHSSGIPRFGNDLVNLSATSAGALLGFFCLT